MKILFIPCMVWVVLMLCSHISAEQDIMDKEQNKPYVVVLGIGQDGGIPHAGVKDHEGWENKRYKRLAACLGIVDPVSNQRWMVGSIIWQQMDAANSGFPLFPEHWVRFGPIPDDLQQKILGYSFNNIVKIDLFLF